MDFELSIAELIGVGLCLCRLNAELLTRLRRVLDHRVSVGGLTEVALWLGGGYLTIGLVWSFFHPDGVQRIQKRNSNSSCICRPAPTTNWRRWVKRACCGR